MAQFEDFKCEYCGKHMYWDVKKGSRPPAYSTARPEGDRCPKSPDRRHHYEPVSWRE